MQGQSQRLLSLTYPKLGNATYSKPTRNLWQPLDHQKLYEIKATTLNCDFISNKLQQALVFNSLILPKKTLARYGVERGAILLNREDRVEGIDRLPVFVDLKWKHRNHRGVVSCDLSFIPNHSLQESVIHPSSIHYAVQSSSAGRSALQTNGCCLDRLSYTSYHSWWNAFYVTSFSRSDTRITDHLCLTFCLDPKGRDRPW